MLELLLSLVGVTTAAAMPIVGPLPRSPVIRLDLSDSEVDLLKLFAFRNSSGGRFVRIMSESTELLLFDCGMPSNVKGHFSLETLRLRDLTEFPFSFASFL